MAYCSDCGVYYTGVEDICPSCGNHVSQKRKPEAGSLPEVGTEVPIIIDGKDFPSGNNAEGNTDLTNRKDNFQKQNITQNDKMNSESNQSEVIYFQNESQLGKGIIKPQKVEMAVDGVHFKYETPPHSFMKEGPIKEKPKEYRVTSADMELKSPDGNCLEKTFREKQPLPQATEQGKADAGINERKPSEEKPEAQAARETKIEQEEQARTLPDELKESGTPVANEKAEATLESIIKELIPEPVIPEPELPENHDNIIYDDGTIWEGAQSWFKIPLGDFYKVTSRSLMIFDKHHYKLFDVSLSLITEITVKQSWLGKLMNIGDLLISIPEFAAQKVVLGGISDPYKVKNMIEERLK